MRIIYTFPNCCPIFLLVFVPLLCTCTKLGLLLLRRLLVVLLLLLLLGSMVWVIAPQS